MVQEYSSRFGCTNYNEVQFRDGLGHGINDNLIGRSISRTEAKLEHSLRWYCEEGVKQRDPRVLIGHLGQFASSMLRMERLCRQMEGLPLEFLHRGRMIKELVSKTTPKKTTLVAGFDSELTEETTPRGTYFTNRTFSYRSRLKTGGVTATFAAGDGTTMFPYSVPAGDSLITRQRRLVVEIKVTEKDHVTRALIWWSLT